MGDGTHEAVLSSYEYLSQGPRQYNLDNTMDGLYIAPAFMDKLVVHISKNFMKMPNTKCHLSSASGEARALQCEIVFAKMGINPIMMSAGELESGNAGEASSRRARCASSSSTTSTPAPVAWVARRRW